MMSGYWEAEKVRIGRYSEINELNPKEPIQRHTLVRIAVLEFNVNCAEALRKLNHKMSDDLADGCYNRAQEALEDIDRNLHSIGVPQAWQEILSNSRQKLMEAAAR
jgi:hypothetical protein